VFLVSIFVMSIILGTYPFWMPNYPVIESAEAAAFEPDTIYQNYLAQTQEAIANRLAVAEIRHQMYIEHRERSDAVLSEALEKIIPRCGTPSKEEMWRLSNGSITESAWNPTFSCIVRALKQGFHYDGGWQYGPEPPVVSSPYRYKLSGLWGLFGFFTPAPAPFGTTANLASRTELFNRFFGNKVFEAKECEHMLCVWPPMTTNDLLIVQSEGRAILNDSTARIIPPDQSNLIKWKASALITDFARSRFVPSTVVRVPGWIEYFPNEIGKKRVKLHQAPLHTKYGTIGGMGNWLNTEMLMKRELDRYINVADFIALQEINKDLGFFEEPD